MRTILPFVVCAALGLTALSCRTASTPAPDTGTNAVTKEFLVSHGFRHEEGTIYSRHYASLREASLELGFSPDSLVIPPNGSDGEPDLRTVDLQGMGFVVIAEGSGRLNDLSTPCSVSVSLVQVPRHPRKPSPGARPAVPRDWVFTGRVARKAEGEEAGTRWATVFVTFDKGGPLLDEVRLSYHPADGILTYSCWMGKPMPALSCPARIPALITAHEGKRCRLVFTSARWDLPTRDMEQITLKSLEWIPGEDK